MKSDNLSQRISTAEMLELRRWNTPTIYNGWEQITAQNPGEDAFNLEPTVDYMPQMGAMVGRAITVVCEPSNPIHKKQNSGAWSEYRRYVASLDGPKVVVVQDLDKPRSVGAFWGEVNSSIHRALGCVGTITDGSVRDVDEMCNAGFKALARRMCVGHAYSCPVRWNCEVEVFGRRVDPGQLIHGDKHGFMVIKEEEEAGLLEAARYLDSQECQTVISAALDSSGLTMEQKLAKFDEAGARYVRAVKEKFKRSGEF